MGTINGVSVESVANMFGVGSNSFRDRVVSLENTLASLKRDIVNVYLELDQYKNQCGGNIDQDAPMLFQEENPDMRVVVEKGEPVMFSHYGFRFWNNGRGVLKYVTLPVRGCMVQFTQSGNYEVLLRKIPLDSLDTRILDSVMMTIGGLNSRFTKEAKFRALDVHPHCMLAPNSGKVVDVCRGDNPWAKTLEKPKDKATLMVGMGRLYHWMTEINYGDCFGNMTMEIDIPASGFSRREPDRSVVDKFLEMSKRVSACSDWEACVKMLREQGLRVELSETLEKWVSLDEGDDSYMTAEDFFNTVSRRYNGKWFENIESVEDVNYRWNAESKLHRYPLMQTVEELKGIVVMSSTSGYLLHVLCLIMFGTLLSMRNVLQEINNDNLRNEMVWDMLLMPNGVLSYRATLKQLGEYTPYTETGVRIGNSGNRYDTVFKHLKNVLGKVNGIVARN